MNWLNYYNNVFLKQLEDTDRLRKNAQEDILCDAYVKLFNTACELIKLYINYNGLFQFEKRDVVKEAFYVELIEDGEIWINALSLAEVYETEETKNFNNLILSYCADEYFSIFKKLKDKFEQIKEEYE